MKHIKLKNLKDQRIIYFDGVCNLCNRAVRFIIAYDKKCVFSFSSLQSEFAGKNLKKTNGQHINYESVIYQFGGQVFIKSDVVFEVLKELGGLWKLFLVFRILPKSVLDKLYDFVAAHRYSWFGKRDRCMIPSPELKSRFLE